MTTRLLNAAVMPRSGVYSIRVLTPAQFRQRVIAAMTDRDLVSYIGYPNAADVLAELVGRPIELNRNTTPVEDGDTLLIARLSYRVGNPASKGQVQATLADYEFFECDYADPK